MKEQKKKGVLADHKREGKRLIPPMMRLPNVVETSFRDTKIPELIWISALFNRAQDKAAVDGVVEFQITCQKAIAIDDAPPLSFLSNFDRLSASQKNAIVSDSDCSKWITILQKELWHQHMLFDRYPLAFIFPDRHESDRTEAIARLKQDVHGLLDRYSHHATKVQTIAIVAMMDTGKMYINKSIDFPDPNLIFTNPDSLEAQRVASFARAGLNAGTNMDTDNDVANRWVDDFWSQTFKLEGCS